MARRQTLQDATGVMLDAPPTGNILVVRAATPTNSQPGFAHGCLWVNTAGGSSTTIYYNSGTNTSSIWTNIV